MEEDAGIGTGTIVAALFIMILILVLVLTDQRLLGESKETFEDTFNTQEAIDAFKDAIRDEQDRVLIELENIADIFEEAFNKESQDCIVKIDTSSFSDDIIVEFKDNKIMRVLKEEFQEKIARKNLNNKVYVKGEDNFALKEFRQVELNGINNIVAMNTGQLVLYKDISGNFIFPTDALLETFNNEISCDSSIEVDRLVDKLRSEEIDNVRYLLELIKIYYNEGLEVRALDTYYRLYRLVAQGTLVVSTEQWLEVEDIWEKVVANKFGDWYLCKSRTDNVYRCLNIIIPPMSVEGSCNLELNEIPRAIPKYDTLRRCETERLDIFGILPDVNL